MVVYNFQVFILVHCNCKDSARFTGSYQKRWKNFVDNQGKVVFFYLSICILLAYL